MKKKVMSLGLQEITVRCIIHYGLSTKEPLRAHRQLTQGVPKEELRKNV